MNHQAAPARDPHQIAAKWNREHPVGTKGLLRRDMGWKFGTEVTQAAFVHNSGEVVASFKNLPGFFLAESFTRDDQAVCISGPGAPPPLVDGAVELLQEYTQLPPNDRGRLLAIARVMRATAS